MDTTGSGNVGLTDVVIWLGFVSVGTKDLFARLPQLGSVALLPGNASSGSNLGIYREP
jgi:hypothetical protein